MTSFDWMDDDDAMMAELKAAVAEADAAPDRLLRDTKAGFGRRAVGQKAVVQKLERLTLESDSLLSDLASVRCEGYNAARVLSFKSPGIGLEMEITDRVAVGQVCPMRAALITLIGAADLSIETGTDELGCFIFDRIPNGPLRVRCDTQEASFITDWLTT